jgi:hypothetical protein
MEGGGCDPQEAWEVLIEEGGKGLLIPRSWFQKKKGG